MKLTIRPNFCLQFEDRGLTLSCGVGPGHYCDNHSSDIMALFTTIEDFQPLDLGQPWVKEKNPDTPSKRWIEPKVPGPTTTMEVALFRSGAEGSLPSEKGGSRVGDLIQLVNDTVEGRVPLSTLSGLLKIMQSDHSEEDRIEMICFLLKETE